MAKLHIRDAQSFALRKIGERGGAFQPFLLGWQHGFMTRLPASPAEVQGFVNAEIAAGRFPSDIISGDWISTYLNGRDDGIKSDTTRVAMMRRNGDQTDLGI